MIIFLSVWLCDFRFVCMVVLRVMILFGLRLIVGKWLNMWVIILCMMGMWVVFFVRIMLLSFFSGIVVFVRVCWIGVCRCVSSGVQIFLRLVLLSVILQWWLFYFICKLVLLRLLRVCLVCLVCVCSSLVNEGLWCRELLMLCW